MLPSGGQFRYLIRDAIGRFGRFLGLSIDTRAVPKRVAAIIRRHEIESEQLIGWAQLVLVLTFAALYLLAPRPSDAGMTMLAPVPLALIGYFIFTLVRLRLAYRSMLPGWMLVVSILSDIALLLGLIWSFHYQYAQPAAFSLKVPTFIYVFVLIALRALRFDHRFVLCAGLSAAGGWALLTMLAIRSGGAGITRNFAAYINGNAILIGAEFDKVFAILMATLLLTLAARRAQSTLITAIREESAGREIRRFLSHGVGDVIASAETLVAAGEATERNAAILMLDLRGFTRFSATVPPAEVVLLLTGFHDRVVPLIRRNHGVIDKFLGDGVMATFGAVSPSTTAAADALQALEAIMRETHEWRETIGTSSTAALEVNGAVAAGPVVFATIGSADRLEYTVIGEAVNLAAKLEKHNKAERTKAITPWLVYELARLQGYTPEGRIERRRGAVVAGVADPIDLAILSAGSAL